MREKIAKILEKYAIWPNQFRLERAADEILALMNEEQGDNKRAKALDSEVELLTNGLKTANAEFEKYERKYYLELDTKEAAESRVKELEAEVERLLKKCTDTAFAWAEAVDKYETCDVDNEHLKAESQDWRKVVQECERIVGCEDTAESPLMSNLPNIVRDLKYDLDNKYQRMLRCNAITKAENRAEQAEAALTAERDLNSRLRTAMESERSKFEAVLVKLKEEDQYEAQRIREFYQKEAEGHLNTHLCLKKHGLDEKPEKRGRYYCDIKFPEKWMDPKLLTPVDWTGEYWVTCKQYTVTAWYSLPESEVEG